MEPAIGLPIHGFGPQCCSNQVDIGATLCEGPSNVENKLLKLLIMVSDDVTHCHHYHHRTTTIAIKLTQVLQMAQQPSS